MGAVAFGRSPAGCVYADGSAHRVVGRVTQAGHRGGGAAPRAYVQWRASASMPALRSDRSVGGGVVCHASAARRVRRDGSAHRVALPRWWGASRKPGTAGGALGLEHTCSGVCRRRCRRSGRTARLGAVAFGRAPAGCVYADGAQRSPGGAAEVVRRVTQAGHRGGGAGPRAYVQWRVSASMRALRSDRSVGGGGVWPLYRPCRRGHAPEAGPHAQHTRRSYRHASHGQRERRGSNEPQPALRRWGVLQNSAKTPFSSHKVAASFACERVSARTLACCLTKAYGGSAALRVLR